MKTTFLRYINISWKLSRKENIYIHKIPEGGFAPGKRKELRTDSIWEGSTLILKSSGIHCALIPYVCMLTHLSRAWLFVTLWTTARQAPLSMGFSRQEYWRGVPFPSPGESSPTRDWTHISMSPALAGKFFTPHTSWEAPYSLYFIHTPEILFLCLLTN